MEELKDKLDQSKLPEHVAVIMDGNGRWAKKKGNQRIFGHRNGVKAVREIVEASAELQLGYLTLYAFSTENWNRPRTEIDALMSLLMATLNSERKTLLDNNVRLQTIGDTASLPKDVAKKLKKTIDETAQNTGLCLVLALSYSSRWEITQAVKQIAQKAAKSEIDIEKIDNQTVSQHLTTKNIPDPELLIRTSGEYRISNFLLWQIAYCELYFSPVLWPDFRKNHFYEALYDFQHRERRFGKISEQI